MRIAPAIVAASALIIAGGVAVHAPHDSRALELIGFAFIYAGIATALAAALATAQAARKG